MSTVFLHQLKDFDQLLRVIGEERGIDPSLVEKDYWIMHALYGLSAQGYDYVLKGGTSLSKGHRIIHRFSEDIDIYIRPAPGYGISENSLSRGQAARRRSFYDSLATAIRIPGFVEVERDYSFDDELHYRSGGIRLKYESRTGLLEGLKEGILLEVGFDTVTPNERFDIGSWAYERAVQSGASVIDNQATAVACYHPGYTFVEKLQAVATKYRKERESGVTNPNFMRQYYDLYCLLDHSGVIGFIGTQEYLEHKRKRFPRKDLEVPIHANEAFLLSDPAIREAYTDRYHRTSGLYYQGQPPFEDVMDRIRFFLARL